MDHIILFMLCIVIVGLLLAYQLDYTTIIQIMDTKAVYPIQPDIADGKMELKNDDDKLQNIQLVRSVSPEEWTPPHLPDHLQGADQYDADLISEIRRSWMIEPDTQHLNLSHPDLTYFAQVRFYILNDIVLSLRYINDDNK